MNVVRFVAGLSILLAVCSSNFSCKKNDFVTDPSAPILFSADTLYLDTVFTSRGSVTRSIRIINPNTQNISVSLNNTSAGSPYFLNLNGVPVNQQNTITINGGDSAYLFVRATIDPTNSNSPFLIEDSVQVSFNGNIKWLQLRAYGQNANYISDGIISANTTWNSDKPYVITRPLRVNNNATLTINAGARIYFDATAFLRVDGKLRANGTPGNRITFRGSRLDEIYRDLPGTWAGIVFTTSSIGSELHNADITNAYQGVIIGGNGNTTPAQLIMKGVRIHNIYDAGIYALNASLQVENCEITQCGNDGVKGTGGSNILLTGGGAYSFNHCTIATYGNSFQNHKQPSFFASNSANGSAMPMLLNIRNSIIYGQSGFTEDELVTEVQNGAGFSGSLANSLFKAKTDPAGLILTGTLKNTDPLFDTVNTSRRLYNFRLKSGSPCIDAANSNLQIDLDGENRPKGVKPDMGAYEKE